MSRRFVSENADHYPVTRLCFLVDVRRSTYYQWRHRPLSKRDLDDAKLAHEIVEIHQASHGTYGAPRESMANSGIGVDVLVASGWPGS